MLVCASTETQTLDLMQTIGVNGPYTLERLSGGCSGSEVVKVNTQDKSYVVRFWNMQWVDYFPQDLACQLVASDAGYGPKVYFYDEEQCITVMDYYFSEPLPEIQVRLQALVDLLKKIHTGPKVPKGVDRAEYIDSLIEELKDIPLFDLEAIRGIKNSVFATTRPSANCVPCHRDLHHGNLLYSQGCFFAIDYTWGAMDDPYTDLANIAVFNCKNDEEERLLLQLYLGHPPGQKEVARLSLMKLPIKIFYGLECLGIARGHKVDEQIIPKPIANSYINIGRYGYPSSNANDFLLYAVSFLNEVMDYSLSPQYVNDLQETSNH